MNEANEVSSSAEIVVSERSKRKKAIKTVIAVIVTLFAMLIATCALNSVFHWWAVIPPEF